MSFEFHPFLLPEETGNIKKHIWNPKKETQPEPEPVSDIQIAKVKKSFTYCDNIQYSASAKALRKNHPTNSWHRPFDFHGAPKFPQHTIFKDNLVDAPIQNQRTEEKEAAAKVVTKKEKNQKHTSEMHAYYFMELLEDLQDELLVQHKIIVPDEIRKDLEKMKNFIENNAFVPIEKILHLLENGATSLIPELCD